MRYTEPAAALTLIAALAGCAALEPTNPDAIISTPSAPILPDAIDSNGLDFILPSDPGVFTCIQYNGRIRAKMPDTRHNRLFASGVYNFSARFEDGTSVGIWVHPDVGSQDSARQLALQVSDPVGKLPTVMRSKLDHVVIHEGNFRPFFEHLGRFFVVYSKDMASRIQRHDLEETVFYHSVHATLDHPRRESAEWKRAQRADGNYITERARRYPRQEDMAESALFAWTVLIHPSRLPIEVESSVHSIIPNRLAYFEKIFGNSDPVFEAIGPAGTCLDLELARARDQFGSGPFSRRSASSRRAS